VEQPNKTYVLATKELEIFFLIAQVILRKLN
jgi:hypothetical protein